MTVEVVGDGQILVGSKQRRVFFFEEEMPQKLEKRGLTTEAARLSEIDIVINKNIKVFIHKCTTNSNLCYIIVVPNQESRTLGDING